MTATTSDLLTVPAAVVHGGLPVDRTRTVIRRREAELVAAGVIVRVGPHKLVRADRLDELAALVTGGAR